MAGADARRIERWFAIAMVVKGVDGVAELLAAVAVALVPAAEVHHLVADVLARDVLGPVDGWPARHLLTAADQFATGDRAFAALYLGLHGAVKIALVAALLRKWLRAYPVAIAVLGALVVYELYRAVHTGSVLLPVLAALDVAVIVLVAREYRLLRRERVSRGR